MTSDVTWNPTTRGSTPALMKKTILRVTMSSVFTANTVFKLSIMRMAWAAEQTISGPSIPQMEEWE